MGKNFKACNNLLKWYSNDGLANGRQTWTTGEKKIMRCIMLDLSEKIWKKKRTSWKPWKSNEVLTGVQLNVMNMNKGWFGRLNRSMKTIYSQAQDGMNGLRFYTRGDPKWTRCEEVACQPRGFQAKRRNRNIKKRLSFGQFGEEEKSSSKRKLN